MADRETDDATRELIEQWNIAESRIKKAEQVRANEVVAAAIFETSLCREEVHRCHYPSPLRFGRPKRKATGH